MGSENERWLVRFSLTSTVYERDLIDTFGLGFGSSNSQMWLNPF